MRVRGEELPRNYQHTAVNASDVELAGSAEGAYFNKGPQTGLRQKQSKPGIYGRSHNNSAATHPLGSDPRGGTRFAPRLYDRKPEQGHPTAGHSYGSGDGAGVTLRRGRRFLGGAP